MSNRKDRQFSIGVDFGTNSVRALIVDCADGREVSSAVSQYPTGSAGLVLDPQDPNLARQHPADYLGGFEAAVRGAVSSAAERSAFSADRVVGIGIDATGSTPLPVDSRGTALAMTDRFAGEPAAMAWLWKDHTSHAEAAEITDRVRESGRPYLEKCGGTYSSEWYWSKLTRCLRDAPEVVEAAAGWVELSDFIPAQVTDRAPPDQMARNICAAGHKAMYADAWGGLPDAELLSSIDPRLARFADGFAEKAIACDRPAGTLSTNWADATGLPAGIPVAAGALDAHHGAVGAGVRPGRLVKIMGTSTCDIIVAGKGVELPDLPGVCGVVPGSVIPGLVAIEAGQSAVGDIFDWFVRSLGSGSGNTGAAHERLTAEAAGLEPGASGLLALDWNNGNRTVLVDPLLSGLVVGLSLHSTRAEVYRALIEATAFGALTIIQRCEDHGVRVDEIIACGGIAEKNDLVMQIYADVCDRPIRVSASSQTCALGAAVFGAVVGGAHPDALSAQSAMTRPGERVFEASPERARIYADLFELYSQLHDAFGGVKGDTDLAGVMKRLISIRDRTRR